MSKEEMQAEAKAIKMEMAKLKEKMYNLGKRLADLEESIQNATFDGYQTVAEYLERDKKTIGEVAKAMLEQEPIDVIFEDDVDELMGYFDGICCPVHLYDNFTDFCDGVFDGDYQSIFELGRDESDKISPTDEYFLDDRANYSSGDTLANLIDDDDQQEAIEALILSFDCARMRMEELKEEHETTHIYNNFKRILAEAIANLGGFEFGKD